MALEKGREDDLQERRPREKINQGKGHQRDIFFCLAIREVLKTNQMVILGTNSQPQGEKQSTA